MIKTMVLKLEPDIVIFQKCIHCGNIMVATLHVFVGDTNRCNLCNKDFIIMGANVINTT
jgi:hypothetical protein